MKKTRLEEMQEQISRHFAPEEGQRIAADMQKEYDALREAYANQPKAMENHTNRNIFPVVAAFRALMTAGMERPQASELAQSTFLALMEAPANAIRKALKVPGLYRLMPWIWKTVMPRMFGEEAGFRFRFYPTDGKQVKFDMLACPYLQVCKDLDCQELAPVFCATDDTCYGHMHPKLLWNRTKTLARGADLCDFDLYIPKK